MFSIRNFSNVFAVKPEVAVQRARSWPDDYFCILLVKASVRTDFSLCLILGFCNHGLTTSIVFYQALFRDNVVLDESSDAIALAILNVSVKFTRNNKSQRVVLQAIGLDTIHYDSVDFIGSVND